MTWQITTSNSAETEQVGADLGARLRGGEVIELRSDLGGGKTTLVRGLAHGAGSQDAVASPSFTISREYQAGELTLHHYDFYRLAEAGLMSQELADVLGDPKAVVIVEWAGIVEDVLPADRITIEIISTAEDARQLTCMVPSSLQYMKGDKA